MGISAATDAQLEAEVPVRKLVEEIWLEKDMQLSTIVPAAELADRWGSRVVRWRS